MANIYKDINEQLNTRRAASTVAITANVANPYELAYMQSKSNPFFDEQDWDKFRRRGELDSYLGILQSAKDTLDFDAVSKDYGFNWLNGDTRLNAIWNELNKDSEELKKVEMRHEDRWNFDTEQYDKIEIGEMSGYEYNKLLITQIKNTQIDEFKHKLAEDVKRNMSGFGKFMGTTFSTLVLGPTAGFTEIMDDLFTQVGAIANGIEALFTGGNFGEAHRKTFGEVDAYGNQISDAKYQISQGLRDAIIDFESQYSWVRKVDGEYTNYGKIAGGVGTSLGKVIPSIIANKLGGAFLDYGSKGLNFVSGASEFLYYAGLGSGTYKEMVNNPMMVSVPTGQIMANAALKTGIEWFMQAGLARAFGTTALDKMTFGHTGGKSFGGTGFVEVSKRVLLDAAHEGIEELSQDFASYLLDSAFGVGVNKKFGQMSEWNFQTALDAFVLGALSVVASSVFSVATTRRTPLGTAVDQDGNIIVDMKGRAKQDYVGKFASWIERADMQTMAENYHAIMNDKKMSQAQKEAAVGQLYTAMRSISSIYGEIGEARFTEATKLIQDMQEAAKKLALTDEQLKEKAKQIFYIAAGTREAYVTDKFERVTNRLLENGMTEAITAIERGQDMHGLPEEVQDAVAATIEQIYNADPDLNSVVVTRDGTGPVLDDFTGTLFAPLAYLVNTDGKMVLENIAEIKLVDGIQNTDNAVIQNTLKEVKRIFEQVTNRTDVDMSEVVYNIMFNDSFYRICLATANQQMFQFLSHLDTIENEIVAKNERDAVYKKKLSNAKKQMAFAITAYVVNQQNANYSDLKLITDKRRKLVEFIQQKRWGKDLANRVIAGQTLDANDIEILKTRINAAPISAETKADIRKGLGFTEDWKRTKSTQNSRYNSLMQLNQHYTDYFFSPFDGQRYLKSDLLQNNIFNEWLMTNGLDIDDVLSLNKDERAALQEKFLDRTNGAWSFKISKGEVTVVSRFKTQGTYIDYQKEREGIKSGKPRDGMARQFVNVRDGRGQLDTIIGNHVDAATRGYATLADLIIDPTKLKRELQQKILDEYGKVNSYTAFLFLREHTLDQTGTMSIVARPDGTFTYVDIHGMLDMLTKKTISRDMLGKPEKGNIKLFINEKFLPVGSRLADITVVLSGTDLKTEYDAATNTITIARDANPAYFRFALLHEFQHAVQTENNLNGGLNANWLLGSGMTDAEIMTLLKDVKKNRPDLLPKHIVLGSQLSKEIVQKFLYDASGESQAMGMEGDTIVDFQPALVKRSGQTTELVTPWGTTYNIGKGQSLELADGSTLIPRALYSEWDEERKKQQEIDDNLSENAFFKRFTRLQELEYDLNNSLDGLIKQYHGSMKTEEGRARITEVKKQILQKVTPEIRRKSLEFAHQSFMPNVHFDVFLEMDVPWSRASYFETEPASSILSAAALGGENADIISSVIDQTSSDTSNTYYHFGLMKVKDIFLYIGTGRELEILMTPDQINAGDAIRVDVVADTGFFTHGQFRELILDKKIDFIHKPAAYRYFTLKELLTNNIITKNELAVRLGDTNPSSIFGRLYETTMTKFNERLSDLDPERRQKNDTAVKELLAKITDIHNIPYNILRSEAAQTSSDIWKELTLGLNFPPKIIIETDTSQRNQAMLFGKIVEPGFTDVVLNSPAKFVTVEPVFGGPSALLYDTSTGIIVMQNIDKGKTTEYMPGNDTTAQSLEPVSAEPVAPERERTRITQLKIDENKRFVPFKGKLLSVDIQNLIVEADYKYLDRRVKQHIDDGTLNIQTVNNVIRDPNQELNTYTFQLLNKHVYKNEFIKTPRALYNLTQQDTYIYYAIRRILMDRGMVDLLTEVRTPAETMQTLRHVLSDPVVRAAVQSARVTFEQSAKGRPISIDRGNLRVAFMRMYDGTLETSGMLADMARSAAIANPRATTDVKTTRTSMDELVNAVADVRDHGDPEAQLFKKDRTSRLYYSVFEYMAEQFDRENPNATAKQVMAFQAETNRKLTSIMEGTSDTGHTLETLLASYRVLEVADIEAKLQTVEDLADTVEKQERKLASIQKNIQYWARELIANISVKEFARLSPEIQEMFTEKKRLRREYYDTRRLLDDNKQIKQVGKTRAELLELESQLRTLGQQARDGLFKNKTSAEIARQLEKTKAELQRAKGRLLVERGKKRQTTTVERVVVLNGREFDITSDVEIPPSLKEILDTTFDEFSKAETQHLTGASELKTAITMYLKGRTNFTAADIDVLVSALINKTVAGKGIITEADFKDALRNERNAERFTELTEDDASAIYKLYNEGIQERITEGDRNMQMNLNKFFEANAIRLGALTQGDIDAIVDFYANAVLSGRLTRDNIRKFDAFQIYMLAYILEQSRQNVWKLTTAQVNTIETKLELMASLAGTNLAVWRAAMKRVDPNRAIIQAIERSSGIELREADVEAVSDAMKAGDIKAVQEAQARMLQHALEDNKGRKRSVWNKIWAFERMAMLSGPGTWVRNHVSNALVTVGNNASSFLGNLFVKKPHKKGQYVISGTKVDQATANFITNNFVANGFLDSLMDGLSKFDNRHTRSKTSGVDAAVDMIARAVETQVLNHARLAKGEKADAALKMVPNFIMKMLSDDPWIKKRTQSYLGKMLVEDKTDLSQGLSHDVLVKLSEAFTAASFDYMRKPNALTKMEQALKQNGGELAFFAYKQVLPFAAASWNWFTEGLRYTPLGLVKAIVDFAKLENTISNMELKRARGEHVMSSRFAEYLARRNIGKGIIGSIGFGIGILLGALGVASIDEEDDKLKLRVGDVHVDITGLFGTQSIFIGMAVTNPRKGNWEKYLIDVFEVLATESIMGDMFNTFRFNNTVGEFLLDQPNRMLGMFIPNMLKTFSSLLYNHNIQYSKGFIGKLERAVAQGIPGLAHAFPKRYDPYTGELQSRYKIPFIIDLLNRMLPIKVNDLNMSEAEKDALALGVRKGELTGRYDDIDAFNTKQRATLNQKYGELNAAVLNTLPTSRTKYRVQMPDGKYKELTYSQMTDEQKKRVIDRLMANNALYAKVYTYTNSGGKYYASDSDYDALRKLGITRNVFKENVKRELQGFI